MSCILQIVTRLFRTRLKDTSRDPLSRPDIRTLLTMLILALLSAGDARLKGDVIETKGLISGVVKGLAEDSEVVINHVLVTLFTDIAQDRAVALETRRAVFDESCITEVSSWESNVDFVDADGLSIAHQTLRRPFRRRLRYLCKIISPSILLRAHRMARYANQRFLDSILRTAKSARDDSEDSQGY